MVLISFLAPIIGSSPNLAPELKTDYSPPRQFDIIKNLKAVNAEHLIDSILGYLDYNDFKQLHLVSKLYNTSSKKFVKKYTNRKVTWIKKSAFEYSKLEERASSSLHNVSHLDQQSSSLCTTGPSYGHFSKIITKPSAVFRQLAADGSAAWLDSSFLEDRLNRKYDIPLIHLNYVWWLDVKVMFQLTKTDILNNLPNPHQGSISKISLKSRWHIKFNEKITNRQRYDSFDKYTNHCSDKATIEICVSIISAKAKDPGASNSTQDNLPLVGISGIPNQNLNFYNNTLNFNANINIDETLIGRSDPNQHISDESNEPNDPTNSKKTKKSFNVSSLYGNFGISPNSNNFAYNKFVYLETNQLCKVLNLDRLKEDDVIQIICRYHDLDCSQFKSDIDFAFVDLVVQEF